MENQTGQSRPPASSITSKVVPSNNQDQQSSKGNCCRKFKTFAACLLKVDNAKWLEDMRGNLSMVAALISTITFQAALNPPGGVVQTSTETEKTLFGCSHVHSVTSNETLGNTICMGQAVLAILYPYGYLRFLKFNTFSFVASLSAALLLVSGIPLRHRFPMWFLSIAMSASLTSLAITYLLGVLMVTPDPIFDATANSFEKFMWIWIGLLLLISLFITIRFLDWVVRKCRRLFKRLRNKGNTSSDPQNNVP